MFLECRFSLYALCECIMCSVHDRRFILRRSRVSFQNQQNKHELKKEVFDYWFKCKAILVFRFIHEFSRWYAARCLIWTSSGANWKWNDYDFHCSLQRISIYFSHQGEHICKYILMSYNNVYSQTCYSNMKIIKDTYSK